MKKLYIFLLALCLTACSFGKGGENDIVASETMVVYGGELNLSMAASDTLDPLLAADETVREGLFTVYEPLIAVTADMELRGVLAESWSFNSDATALSVKLKEGVLWHDGSELTAKDVVYTINRIKGESSSPYKELLRYVSAATENSAYTVTIDLSRSYSQIVYSLYFPIVSLKAGSLENAAVGTGPFMFESYSPGQALTLTRFEGYHDGKAGFDKINFHIVKESITMASAFSTGVTNAIQGRIYNADEFTVRGKFESRQACGGRFEYVGLNHRKSVFTSAAVRSAISNAINRAELINGSYGANAAAANLPMHPSALCFTPSPSLTDFNLAGAKETLFYDGWVENSEGILGKEYVNVSRSEEDGKEAQETYSGVRLKFGLLVNKENSRRVAAANIIAAQLSKVGISVSVTEESFEEYISRIKSGDFDAYLGGTEIGNLYDLEFLLSSDGSQNYGGYSGEYMDKALSRLAEANGEEEFIGACSVIQEIFIREQPIVGIAFLNEQLYMAENIAGATAPMFKSPFANVGRWFYKS